MIFEYYYCEEKKIQQDVERITGGKVRVRMQPEGERGRDMNIVSERRKIHSRKGRNQLVEKKYCYWERVNIQPEDERGTGEI